MVLYRVGMLRSNNGVGIWMELAVYSEMLAH
jgi:hypothetical protein